MVSQTQRRLLSAACLAGVLVLSSCGTRAPAPVARAPSAEGPIQAACLAAGRDAASRALCGCVQAAADQSLTVTDQTRAAGFFADPQLAQDTRASQTRAADAFWERYQGFVETARGLCR